MPFAVFIGYGPVRLRFFFRFRNRTSKHYLSSSLKPTCTDGCGVCGWCSCCGWWMSWEDTFLWGQAQQPIPQTSTHRRCLLSSVDMKLVMWLSSNSDYVTVDVENSTKINVISWWFPFKILMVRSCLNRFRTGSWNWGNLRTKNRTDNQSGWTELNCRFGSASSSSLHQFRTELQQHYTSNSSMRRCHHGCYLEWEVPGIA